MLVNIFRLPLVIRSLSIMISCPGRLSAKRTLHCLERTAKQSSDILLLFSFVFACFMTINAIWVPTSQGALQHLVPAGRPTEREEV